MLFSTLFCGQKQTEVDSLDRSYLQLSSGKSKSSIISRVRIVCLLKKCTVRMAIKMLTLYTSRVNGISEKNIL